MLSLKYEITNSSVISALMLGAPPKNLMHLLINKNVHVLFEYLCICYPHQAKMN